jgi:hypothetical protein
MHARIELDSGPFGQIQDTPVQYSPEVVRLFAQQVKPWSSKRNNGVLRKR